MDKRFSEEAALAVNIAFSEAARCGAGYVGSEHLLIGLVLQNGETGALIVSCGGSLASLRAKAEVMAFPQPQSGCEDMTPKLKRILMKATLIAGKGRRVCGAHLLSAMLSEECSAKKIAENVCDTKLLYGGLEKLMLEDKMLQRSKKTQSKPTPLLDKNGRDLTEKALQGGTDPVIGREKEEERVIQILLRRYKNNPCLVGEPGVGKTAVVEAVALRIAEGRVPDSLKNKRVVALDLPSLVAGTKYRGEFEDKLRGIIEEVMSADDVILFADEIHTIVGAGAAEGAIDASNILKPYLARGEIQLIGATTLKEYKRYIEKDGALERRFQRVLLEEPCVEECVQILRGLKERYEKHHSVRISDDALVAAAELSDRFIADRRLPDKAIDLIDEASAAKRMAEAKSKRTPTLARCDVEAALSAQTGISLDAQPVSDSAVYGVKGRVCGQDAAVDTVVAALNRCRAGYSASDTAPLLSFLFTGGRGTGKKVLARELARLAFGTDKRFVRFDMAEYADGYDLQRLIGDESGALTEWVRKAPNSLLLFDNVQSAGAAAISLIKRILEEGCIRDGGGSTVSLRGCIVVLAADTAGGAEAGFCAGGGGGVDRRVKAMAEQVDEWVRFVPLDKAALSAVAERSLAEINVKLSPLGIRIAAEKGFAERFGENCAERGLGAFAVRARLDRQAKTLLSEAGLCKNGVTAMLFCENGEEKLKISVKNC